MRNIIYILLFLPVIVFSQVTGFKYQAVIRDASGDLLYNQQVSIKTTILSGSAIGTEVYAETHLVGTNGYGVVNLNIGSGTVVSGSYSNIDWSSASHFLKTELDITGGNNFQFMGTSQILSVPYAEYAERSGSSMVDNDTSSTNEIQQLTLQGNQLVLSNGGAVTLSGTIDLDPDPTNELQVLSLSNDTLYLSNGNYVVLPPDADGDATNELQILSNTAGTISISNGNSITLQDSSATNELQTLSNTAGTISISSGNSITLQDSSATNELQALNISGNNISISNGNTVTLPPDGDSDATNEIQTLSLSSNSLSISGSNSVTLPANNDNSSTNELQNLTLSNNTLSISNGNSVNLPANNDNSSTNEIQTLTYQNDTLSISNGNQVTINTTAFDFIYPDGKSNVTPLTITAGDTSNTNLGFDPSIWSTFSSLFNRTFTVPQGKNLYITSFYNEYCSDGYTSTNSTTCYNGKLQINSLDLFSGAAYNGNYSLIMFNQPIIIGSGETFSLIPTYSYNCQYSNCNYIPKLSTVNGFLVDSKVTAITFELSNYTVPTGKILIVLNIYGGYNLKVNSNDFFLNSGNFNQFSIGGSSNSNGSNTWLEGYSLIMPLFFNENDVLSSPNPMTINGYLMDK